MRKIIFSAMLLAIVSACERNQIDASEENQMFVENSEEWKDGVYYVDGTAQIDRIEAIEIDGISVVQDRIKFENTEALFSAVEILSENNTESKLNFYEDLGVRTLLTRLDEFDVIYDNDETVELISVVDKYYFNISENEARIQNVSYSIAQVLNENGMIQVGDFVGAFRGDELVWTDEENAALLKESIISNKISDRSEFTRITHENNSRDWVNTQYCPKDYTWYGSIYQYKNPNAVRRIDVQNTWERFIIPVSGGRYDIRYTYSLNTTSRKQSWNKYSTDHYHSISILTNEVVNGVEHSDINFTRKTQRYSSQTSNTPINISYASGVSYGYWFSNFVRLSYVDPGTSGWQGTAGSHRGMAARYGRLRCI